MKLTEEEYLASKGFSRQLIGESALHMSSSRISKNVWTKLVKNQNERDKKICEKREELRMEYREKVMKGEIQIPTHLEELQKIAQGHPDNLAVIAAKKILQKRMI